VCLTEIWPDEARCRVPVFATPVRISFTARCMARLTGKPCMSCVRHLSSFHSNRPYSCKTTIELWKQHSVKYVPPDGFFGIQSLPNLISAGAPPWTPLGKLTTLPIPSSRLGRGTPPPHFPLPSTPSASRHLRHTTFQNLPTPLVR